MPEKTDIWMPLYIGDYLADTSHLDTLEHGAYLLLLMHYWRKGPLENNPKALLSITKLHGPEASSLLQALLDGFFQLSEDGKWHQERADKERARSLQIQQIYHDRAIRGGEATRLKWESRA